MGLAAGSQEGEGGSPAGTETCRVGVSIWPPGHSWGSQGSAGWCLPLPGVWPLMSLSASLSFPWCVCQVDSFGRSYWLAPAGIWLLGGAQGRGPFSLGVCAWRGCGYCCGPGGAGGFGKVLEDGLRLVLGFSEWTLTSNQDPHGSGQWKCALSRGSKCKIKASAGPHPLKAVGENPSFLSSSFWQLLAILGALWLEAAHLSLLLFL